MANLLFSLRGFWGLSGGWYLFRRMCRFSLVEVAYHLSMPDRRYFLSCFGLLAVFRASFAHVSGGGVVLNESAEQRPTGALLACRMACADLAE